jgi:N6-L-threonylcarbamoyladenine synthase
LWLSDHADEVEFPVLALIVSGGHTEMLLIKDHMQYERLGGTLDDAAGEAFDKVGRLLGLPYPGGPNLENTALMGNSSSFDFPRIWLDNSWDFSFSGLKTAVVREVQQRFPELDMGRSASSVDLPVADLAASFQEAIVDVLKEKSIHAYLSVVVSQQIQLYAKQLSIEQGICQFTFHRNFYALTMLQ